MSGSLDTSASGFKLEMEDDSSDDEVLSNVKRKRLSCEGKYCNDNEGQEENSYENEPNQTENGKNNDSTDDEEKSDSKEEENVRKKADSSSESEEEDEDDLPTIEEKHSKKRKRSSRSQQSNSSSSADEEKKSKKSKHERQQGVKQREDSSKMIRLKKYLKVAGIRIQNYAKVFEGCKSKKEKEGKLLSLLEDGGLKGKPTLEKCKKLRKKIERDREVSELDLGNIINYDDDKCSGRRAIRTTRNRMKSVEVAKEETKSPSGETNPFGNLSGIIDAEGSDNEGKQAVEAKKKKRRLIESEDEKSDEESGPIENESD